MYYTVSLDAKEQVLANLSNFSYDPVNYAYLRSLNVIDLFLGVISTPNYHVAGTHTLVHFALAGLCNLCLDKVNKEYIVSEGGVEPVSSLLLNSSHEETVLNAITTLMFLVTPQSKPDITRTEVLVRMLQLSEVTDPRTKHLATIFLADLCSEQQIHEARLVLSTREIPLPSPADPPLDSPAPAV